MSLIYELGILTFGIFLCFVAYAVSTRIRRFPDSEHKEDLEEIVGMLIIIGMAAAGVSIYLMVTK
jgi:hypothetical protein